MDSSSINGGDIIFQFLNICLMALFVILIVSYFRSNKKRRNQLDRMEEKINLLTDEIKKLNSK
jgi:hypothetical protein